MYYNSNKVGKKQELIALGVIIGLTLVRQAFSLLYNA